MPLEIGLILTFATDSSQVPKLSAQATDWEIFYKFLRQ